MFIKNFHNMFEMEDKIHQSEYDISTTLQSHLLQVLTGTMHQVSET